MKRTIVSTTKMLATACVAGALLAALPVHLSMDFETGMASDGTAFAQGKSNDKGGKGGGNSGGGNGNSGNGGGTSKDWSESASKKDASALGKLNAAHANEKALQNASSNSTVGAIAEYNNGEGELEDISNKPITDKVIDFFSGLLEGKDTTREAAEGDGDGEGTGDGAGDGTTAEGDTLVSEGETPTEPIQ